MKILDAPMSIELDKNEIHKLCEAAIGNPNLSEEEKNLIHSICYHMIWDDLDDKIPRTRS